MATTNPIWKNKFLIKFMMLSFVVAFIVGGFTLNLEDRSNWKSYSDPTGTYSVKYPSNWAVSFTESANVNMNPRDSLKDLNLEGKQGKILIMRLDQYGGACLDDYIKMDIGNLKNDGVCHEARVKDNGKDVEIWNTSKELNTKNHLGIWIVAEAYEPISTNRKTILEILSSLKVKQ